jgi:hypothetical protein
VCSVQDTCKKAVAEKEDKWMKFRPTCGLKKLRSGLHMTEYELNELLRIVNEQGDPMSS